MKQSQRIFIALPLPELVLETCAQIQNQWREQHPHLKVSYPAPENLHITLKFLGDTFPDRLKRVSQTLANLAPQFSGFELTTTALSFFPSPQKPRTLYWGLASHPQLNTLAKTLAQNLAKLGYPREKRAFRPHITLGRIRTQIDPNQIHPLTHPPQSFQITEIHLIQSELRPQGSKYTCLDIFPLGPKLN